MPGFFSSLSSFLVIASRTVFDWPRRPHPQCSRVPILRHEKDERNEKPFHAVIQQLQKLIEEDAELYMGFHQMFEQIPVDPKYQFDPAGKPQILNFNDMLKCLDKLLTRAPEFGDKTTGQPVPTPIHIMLTWPMCTSAGMSVFANEKVNAQLKKILAAWAQFLSSPESRYVLTDDVGGWFSPPARSAIPNFQERFVCDPTKEYWGFTSWDDFFTRKYRPGVRPVSYPDDDTTINNACESVTYKISYNAQARDSFWIKGEPYSLFHMLDNDPLVEQFVGGTVYQAYLSAFHYHRWHSPVNGTIVKIVHVPGTYYETSPTTGFNSGGPDPRAPIHSQAFITNVATRSLIFIQADNHDIGLLCFVAVGMGEISSCEETISVGQRVKKGDELGMFHYGGSTYCLVFRPGTKIVFSEGVVQSLKDQRTVLLNAAIGHLCSKIG